MERRVYIMAVIVAMVGLLSGMVCAAPSFLSTSGLILTPDDSLLSPGSFSASFHDFELASTATVIGANVGVTPNLELGVARFDSDAAGADPETMLSGKYLLLPETAVRPSVVIGVVDLNGQIDPGDDASAYIVAGKNLTSVASGLTGEPVEPVRAFVGVGSGIYGGMFAGVEWTLSPRAKIVAEFINEVNIKNALSEESVFNAGITFDLAEAIQGSLATINGDDFAFGLTYVKIGL